MNHSRLLLYNLKNPHRHGKHPIDMDFVRLWLIASGLFVLGWLIWVFVPVLVPAIAVTAGLGVLVWAIVSGARAFDRWFNGPRA